jgi:hypothetical protein
MVEILMAPLDAELASVLVKMRTIRATIEPLDHLVFSMTFLFRYQCRAFIRHVTEVATEVPESLLFQDRPALAELARSK